MAIVSWENFVIEIFFVLNARYELTKTHIHININIVRGHLYENYFTRKFILRNIYNGIIYMIVSVSKWNLDKQIQLL